MFDPDDFVDPDKIAEKAELDELLSKLQDCDLSDWDSGFVDSLLKRRSIMFITPRQWEQLERLRSQYNV